MALAAVHPPTYDVAADWTWRSLYLPGFVVIVPAGLHTDLVSAPWWGCWLLPLRHLAVAALVHDALRRLVPDLPLEIIDALMLLAMIETRVPEPSRTVVWLAVRTSNTRA